MSKRQTPDYLALRKPGYVARLQRERDGYFNPDAGRAAMRQARTWGQGLFWFYANATRGYGLPGGERWAAFRARVGATARGEA